MVGGGTAVARVYPINQRSILHAKRLLPGSRKDTPLSGIFCRADYMHQYFHRQEDSRLPRPSLVNPLFLFAMTAMVSACGATSGSSIIKTVHDIDGAAPFTNVLVVSVAGNRRSRTQFEQELVAAISSGDTLATPYYAVFGRHIPLTRSNVDNAVRDREFDAVLLARTQGQDQANLVSNRPTGRLFDLYHYDYEELNIPVSINTDTTVSFVAEIYDTRAARKVWAIESLIFENETAAAAVSAQAAIIAAELRKDGLFRR